MEALESEESQFIAVYGRRRVGKTFLVRQTLSKYFTFEYSGVANQNAKTQRKQFIEAIRSQGYGDAPTPHDWFEAFRALEHLVEQSESVKKVIFLDEIQWMDNPRSSFLSAFEHFWNGWASARNDIVLIICGSATSWVINKVFQNRGGLYNRVTIRLGLDLFTLAECEEYVKAKNMDMSRDEILEAYMAFGGVPFYWSLLDKKYSVAQNIDNLFFDKKGMLYNEFTALYASMFAHPEPYIDVIMALGTKKKGMKRSELLASIKKSDDGGLTHILADLEHCDFIRKYYSFGKRLKDAIYQLTDSYTLFYFRFVYNRDASNMQWLKLLNSPEYYAWRGLAFEQVCLLHVKQIKAAIGVADVISNVCAWSYPGDAETPGTQIDLLLDRDDGVINMCEMKCTDRPFVIDRDYAMLLKRRRDIFMEKTKTRKTVRITMVASCGLADNRWSREIPNQITADDLFLHK